MAKLKKIAVTAEDVAAALQTARDARKVERELEKTLWTVRGREAVATRRQYEAARSVADDAEDAWRDLSRIFNMASK